MKPKHQRLWFVALSVGFLCVSVLLVLQSLKENIVYFYSPSDVVATPPDASHTIRLGGLVQEGSFVVEAGERSRFIVTDGAHQITVHYQGPRPALFREGQGVVAEGNFQADGIFLARSILAKHDENYMPREVVDALKKSGHWEGEAPPSEYGAPTP